MKRLTAAVAAITMVLVTAPAHADQRTLADPDDVEHSWDIRTFSHGHEELNNARASVYSTTFYEEFVDAADPGWRMVIKLFFEKSAVRPHRRVVLLWEGSAETDRPLHGYIYGRRGQFLGYAKVTHGTGGVHVAIPTRLFPAHVNRHWAQAVVQFSESDATSRMRSHLES